MALPLPTDNAEQRFRAIAEREVAVKQCREKRAKLYGQTFDLIHGLRQFGCTLQNVHPAFPLQDHSISTRAKYIEACMVDASLAANSLSESMTIVAEPSAAGGPSSSTLTNPLPPSQPLASSSTSSRTQDMQAGPARSVRERELAGQSATAAGSSSNNSNASSARPSQEPPEVAAFTQSQVENSENMFRFQEPPGTLPAEASQRPFSQRTLDRHSPSFNPKGLPLTTTGYALPAVTANPTELMVKVPEAGSSASASASESSPNNTNSSVPTSAAAAKDSPAAAKATTIDPRAATVTTKAASPRSHYVEQLPPLPSALSRNRIAIGGLLRQKHEREKERTGHPSHSNILSGGLELYKTGQLEGALLGTRHLLGTPSPSDQNVDPKLHGVRPAKVVTTSEWRVAYQELEAQRAMEKVDQFKARDKWSFRQPKKQRGPHLHKGHWDYLLEEMRWLHADFRQERRWKQAIAFEISTSVLDYFAASPKERQKLCIKTRKPDSTSATAPTNEMADADADAEAEEGVEEEQEDGQRSDEMDEDTQVKSQLLEPSGQQSKASASTTDSGRAPVHPDTAMLDRCRDQIFAVPTSKSVIGLDELVFDKSKQGSASSSRAEKTDASPQTVSCWTVYEPPVPPSTDEQKLQIRRVESSSSLYTRLVPVSHFMESKPLLLSSLNPATKRKWGANQWNDVSDLYEADEAPRPSSLCGSGVSPLFSKQDGTTQKAQHPSLRKEPEAPKNVELRLKLTDWSDVDDLELKALADKYMPNWDLIADLFNGNTFRVEVDHRTAWDVWHRWQTRLGPQAQPEPTAAPGVKKPSRREHHHKAMQETMRKQQRRRDLLPPKPAPSAPRRVTLSAHDTHTMPIPRTTNPMELGRIKAEKDAYVSQQQQLMYRQQAMMRQQSQFAQAQAHQARVIQAQQQQAYMQQQQQQQQQQHQHRGGSGPSVNGSAGSPSDATHQSPTTRTAPTPVPS